MRQREFDELVALLWWLSGVDAECATECVRAVMLVLERRLARPPVEVGHVEGLRRPESLTGYRPKRAA